MRLNQPIAMLLAVWIVGAAGSTSLCLGETEAVLPAGVEAVWDLDKAGREKTATRERVCLNGLWLWQPAAKGALGKDAAEPPPADKWGYFKVPGCWPGVSDYMQKDCQTIYPHPSWKGVKLGEVAAAWYQRDVTIPADWAGRRVSLYAEYLNSYAAAYLDGKKVGELRFPGGELDVTAACPPGAKCVLSLLVVAMPLKGVMLSHSDSAAAKEVKGKVDRRGLCGDVYLVTAPTGPRILDVKVDTSVRKGELALDVAMEGLAANQRYSLSHMIVAAREKDDADMLLMQHDFKGSDLKNGRLAYVVQKWKPDKLWDIHTPANQYRLSLTLLEIPNQLFKIPNGPKVYGKPLDAALPVRFGFREFWIDGRDFYLNGSRIFLSAVPFDNVQVSAGLAVRELGQRRVSAD